MEKTLMQLGPSAHTIVYLVCSMFAACRGFATARQAKCQSVSGRAFSFGTNRVADHRSKKVEKIKMIKKKKDLIQHFGFSTL